ncbi:MAG: hypothetical protein Q7S22_02075 [Candidatus Micrarchaeota archaeon]|nr:hypothetical protein [Candidatus Micrarchaeota archaeon]
MLIKYTRHAITESMPDEKITTAEVEETLKKSSHTVKISLIKYKFYYQGLEVVAQKEQGYWLVITCYRK